MSLQWLGEGDSTSAEYTAEFTALGPHGSGDVAGAAFREFLDRLPIMIWQHDVTGAVAFANAAWYEMLDLPREASSPPFEGWSEVAHPADAERMLAILGGGMQPRSPFELECRLRPAGSDGAYRWYLVRGMPQLGQNGTFHGWISSINDLTERRSEAEQLRSELSDTKMLQSLSAAMLQEENVDALYQTFVDVAVEMMGSDSASLQMLVPERGEAGELLMLASRGLPPAAQEYWKWVGPDAGSSCGESLRTGKRTIATDYRNCPFALRGTISRRSCRPAFTRHRARRSFRVRDDCWAW